LWNGNLHLTQLTRSLSHGWTEMKMQLPTELKMEGKMLTAYHHQGGTTAGATEHSSADLQGAGAACNGQSFMTFLLTMEAARCGLPVCRNVLDRKTVEASSHRPIKSLGTWHAP